MRKSLLVLALAALVLMLPVGAFADTITAAGVTYTGFITGNTVTLSVQCTDNSVAQCASWYLGDQTFKGFGSYTSISSWTVTPSGTTYSAQMGGQNNNSGCNGGDLKGAVCWNATSPYSLMGSQVFTFTATLSGLGDITHPFHVQSLAYATSTGTSLKAGCTVDRHHNCLQSTKVLAVSDDLVLTQTPEPASLALLGSGLLALGGLVRRRKL